MRDHRHVERELYDYLRGDLPSEERQRVERHLEACARCRAARGAIAGLVEAFPPPSARPADSREKEFWSQLVQSIEQATGGKQRRSPAREWQGASGFWMYLSAHRRAIALSAAACLIIAVVLYRAGPPPVSEAELSLSAAPPDAGEPELLGEYLRRSKALLIELENKAPEGKGPLNVSVERAISRELVQEGRRLTMWPLDVHSAALVADLEPIMISVANSGETMGAGDVELIRTGIRQRNLLFKVRMAELTYDPGYITTVMDRRQGR